VSISRCIAAFGSSRRDLDASSYRDVAKLSRKLAEHGWNGMVGGHQGMMAAFCQGMREGGGHVRGITLDCFPTPPNHRLSEEIRAQNFFERMGMLIEQADAYLVLPGGLGTLAELAMSWDLLAIHVLQNRPLVVYGEMWQEILTGMEKQLLFSSPEPLQYIRYCTTHKQVLESIAHE